MYENVKSKTGKSIDEITLNNVLNGNVTPEDIKISSDILMRQGKIADENGRPQIRKNFTRAAELIEVPDNVVLKIYEALRPNRSTKSELLAIASILRDEYKAQECAKFIQNAANVYEKRGILKPER